MTSAPVDSRSRSAADSASPAPSTKPRASAARNGSPHRHPHEVALVLVRVAHGGAREVAEVVGRRPGITVSRSTTHSASSLPASNSTLAILASLWTGRSRQRSVARPGRRARGRAAGGRAAASISGRHPAARPARSRPRRASARTREAATACRGSRGSSRAAAARAGRRAAAGSGRRRAPSRRPRPPCAARSAQRVPSIQRSSRQVSPPASTTWWRAVARRNEAQHAPAAGIASPPRARGRAATWRVTRTMFSITSAGTAEDVAVDALQQEALGPGRPEEGGEPRVVDQSAAVRLEASSAPSAAKRSSMRQDRRRG